MMDIKEDDKKYLNDPEFASMVNYMMSFLDELRVN